MDREQTIDKLWESSNHGTRREDVVAAFEAGVDAERERWRRADGYALVVHHDDANTLRNLPEGQWVILQRRVLTVPNAL